ncbi:MAG: metallophosphoesterase [Planctomycetota bacterium]|nr:metallophosphoesterase [Planctomycetota bacterium]
MAISSSPPGPLEAPSLKKMVAWYNPGQLLKTGADVILSEAFARHADRRILWALQQEHGTLPDLNLTFPADAGNGLWIDYVADCGDGWNPTYAVASTMARPVIDVEDRAGMPSKLPRGQLLVFGGDQVYPTPTVEEYTNRLVRPYEEAFRRRTSCPQVLALPGNHDWYDSLVLFQRIFCSGKKFAGCQTVQKRSYFAARLPENWWLLGTDTQLQHDLDRPQFDYFSGLADRIEKEDGAIILCTPEPFWLWTPIGRSAASSARRPYQRRRFDELFERLESRIKVCLAGDLHHYRRHFRALEGQAMKRSDGDSSAERQHLITCGTGGAFLHTTHLPGQKDLPKGIHLVESSPFPPVRKSRCLAWWNLGFPAWNFWFGVLTGFSYLLIAWANGIYVGQSFVHERKLESGAIETVRVAIPEIGALGISELGTVLRAMAHSTLLSPVGSSLCLLVFLAFWFFTDNESRRFRLVAGVLHALTHLMAAFLLYWMAAYVPVTILGWAPESMEQYLLSGTILVLGGWAVGAFIMGSYLLISVNGFGKHGNEAYSALKIEDWKGFLRMKIEQGGKLTLYFIGLEKIPRWKESELGSGPGYARDGTIELDPKIVDSLEIWPGGLESAQVENGVDRT